METISARQYTYFISITPQVDPGQAPGEEGGVHAPDRQHWRGDDPHQLMPGEWPRKTQ